MREIEAIRAAAVALATAAAAAASEAAARSLEESTHAKWQQAVAAGKAAGKLLASHKEEANA